MRIEDIRAQSMSSLRIESIHVRNFRMLRDVNLKGLSSFAVFIGRNGVGKSTLFQVFRFLKYALHGNVDSALQQMGGYNEVARRNHADEPIIIKIQFKMPIGGKNRLVTYYLKISNGKNGKPVIMREYLSYSRNGSAFYFMEFKEGAGYVVADNDGGDSEKDNIIVKRPLKAPDILAIKDIGQFEEFTAASALRQLIESWHISDIDIETTRQEVKAGVAEHLSETGDNLPLVVQYLYNHKRSVFDGILKRLQKRIPEMSKVEAYQTEKGRVLLRFWDKDFNAPVLAPYVSEGTIRLLTYLVLLYDPKPHPFLCVEEPEHKLPPELMVFLTEEFRRYGRRGGQVFVSTHSPDFMNHVMPEEAYLMEKKDGETQIHPISKNRLAVALVEEEGDKLGYMWRQGLLKPEMP